MLDKISYSTFYFNRLHWNQNHQITQGKFNASCSLMNSVIGTFYFSIYWTVTKAQMYNFNGSYSTFDEGSFSIYNFDESSMRFRI